MANTLKFGNGLWATKEGSTLAYNDENDNYKPLPFDFTRASSATVINKAGLIETVGNGQPRIDYKDNTNGALLLEPQRTNLVTYSNDLSQTVYNGDLRTGSVYGELGFNGENDAWRYTKDNSTSSGFINLTFSGTYTISLFIKKEANKGIYIYNFGDTNQFSKINIENGTYISGVDTVKIEKFSNDWFRVSQTLTVSNGVWYFYLTDGNGSQIATSITLQNFQIEQGSYPTSYIPTQGSAVTRLADSCSQTVPSGIIGQTEGTMFFEIDFANTSGVAGAWSISNGSSANRITMNTTNYSSTHFTLSVAQNYNSGSTKLASSNVTFSDKHKVAIKYSGTTLKLFVDGQLSDSVSTDGFGNYTKFYIGGNQVGVGGDARKFIQADLYNTALTDSECITLTSL